MFQKVLYQFSEGLSLLLSMILITVIVLFSIGVTTLVVDSARQSANVKDGTTAYYAAEAGLEQALWVNKELADGDLVIGAEETGSSNVGSNSNVNFKIQGSATNLLEKTANGKYIVPFPWTGDVPWHGEGSNPGAGGCNSEKPPVRNGEGDAKTFDYLVDGDPIGPAPFINEIEHPCNWGKLAVGEKVSIPLYGFDTQDDYPVSIDDFKIRVRTPCKGGEEFCMPGDRLLLNCWDKGDSVEKCTDDIFDSMQNHLRGEVVLLWQVNAIGEDSEQLALNPNDDTGQKYYYPGDSQFYEGKINTQMNISTPFELLNTDTDGFPSPFPQGIDVMSGQPYNVKDFVYANTKPTLTLSVVSSLVGCSDQAQNTCSKTYDDPGEYDTYDGPHMLPYLEYQIVFEEDDLSGNLPASKDNIISAEGQSGPFNQTIQVKVPHDNSSLEYVIQQ